MTAADDLDAVREHARSGRTWRKDTLALCDEVEALRSKVERLRAVIDAMEADE